MTFIVDNLCTQIVNGEITLKEALLEAYRNGASGNLDDDKSPAHILFSLYGGKNIFTRTVTHHYTGFLEKVADGFLVMRNVSWIADDGRFHDAVTKGTLKEIEPYGHNEIVCVAIGSIVDICKWNFPLPTQQV